ncbi:MAG: hypothetical protein Q7Q71_14195 [Verrucomicrobiota bacterium JB023]|nr:hypothetical protein [Verrucomicrobiota bacterium JB023]
MKRWFRALQSRSWVIGSLLLTGLLLLPLLRNGFVHYDDGIYIVENPLVAAPFQVATIPTAFSTIHEQNYAPLLWLTFRALHEAAGPAPWVFHLVSVLAHLACALLLIRVGRQLGGSWAWTSLLAFLWAIHPQRVESVAWASALKDPASGFFALLTTSLWLSLRRTGGKNPSLTFAMCLCYLASLLFKQAAFPLPWVLLSWHLLMRRDSDQALLKATLPLLLLSLGGALAAWTANREALTQTEFLGLSTPIDQIGHFLSALAFTLRQFLLPWPLAPDYPVPQNALLWRLTGGIALILFILLLGVAIRQRAALLTLALLWAAALWIPGSGLLPIPLEFTADRLTYLPSSLAIVAAGVWASRQLPRGPFLFSLMGLALLWSALNWRAQQPWEDGPSLVSHTLRHYPSHYPSKVNRAVLQARSGRLDESILTLQEAIEDYPLRPGAYEKLIQIHLARGQPQEALDTARRWKSMQPTSEGPDLYLLQLTTRQPHQR